jgi:hypothetical protein
MKSIKCFKSIQKTGVLTGTMILQFIVLSGFFFANDAYTQPDTTSYQTFSGKLVDAESGDPVIFATVFLENTNVGTVSNSEGEFAIKVQDDMLDKELCFTHLGYSLTKVSLNAFNREEDMTIDMYPAKRSIEEITVHTSDPHKLLRMALKRVEENYPSKPAINRAFYRETIKENWHYVAILEAVVDIYKGGYGKDLQYDRAKIFKGRKSRDVKRMDTIFFKLQGGPTTALMLDIAKNPYNLFSADKIDGYHFKMEGIVSINNREAYSIRFEPKDEFEYLIYEGNMYLDLKSLAFSGLEFQIDEEALEEATQFLVRRKPLGMSVEVEGANYITTYREIDGKWHLNYVRAENTFKCNWDNKLFNSTYRTMSEMAITNRNFQTVKKFDRQEVFKSNQSMVDEIDYFYEDDFWGKNNTIRPDENIDAAIRKLNRRLK